MIESIYAEAFLLALFNEDSTLTGASCLNGKCFYRNQRKSGAPMPVGVLNLQAPLDVMNQNRTRAMVEHVFQVRILGKEVDGVLQEAARVRASANRTDELLMPGGEPLRNVQKTFDDGAEFTFATWRLSELPLPSLPGETTEVSYRQYGGLYKVQMIPNL